MKKWTIEKSEIVLDNKWMKVRRDTCLLPTGQCINDYYLWLGNDFSMVFGLTEDSQVILVRQYKHGAQDIVVELPAGLVDKTDPNPQAAAARELKEETGYVAESYTHLASPFIASAKAPTVAHLYMATGLVRVASQSLDSQESVECFLVSVPELMEMVNQGQIRDINSIATIFLALQRLGYIDFDRLMNQESKG
jgi:ADP-ribose pyrophosphatase